jgi:glucose/arabinose dehydrogenase
MTRPSPLARLTACTLAISVVAVACGDDGPRTYDQPVEENDAWSVGVTDWTEAFEMEQWTAEAFEGLTDLRFLPDGRAVAIRKGGWAGAGTGEVFLLSSDGQTLGKILDVPVCTDNERGLLGLEIDPEFESNAQLYLFYTRQMNECTLSEGPADIEPTQPVYNRVSAFTFHEGGIDPASERVILDDLPGHQSSHNAGGLAWLDDGTLLVSVGEAAYRKSRDPEHITGKIVGLNVDRPGEGSPSNPSFDADDPTSVQSLVYASGLRNPFRLSVDPATDRVAVADVGTEDFEEVNLVEPGADYGFPDIEGPGSVDGSAEPSLWYKHEDGCISIIGGDWVPAGWVPGTDRSGYAFSDFGCGGVFIGYFNGNTIDEVARVAPLLGYALSSVILGPDDALYLVGVGPGSFPIVRVSKDPRWSTL